MEDDYESVSRLEGSTGDEVGGLIIKKKSVVEHEFKRPDIPRKSLLGLDKLAGWQILIRHTKNYIIRPS